MCTLLQIGVASGVGERLAQTEELFVVAVIGFVHGSKRKMDDEQLHRVRWVADFPMHIAAVIAVPSLHVFGARVMTNLGVIGVSQDFSDAGHKISVQNCGILRLPPLYSICGVIMDAVFDIALHH